MTNSAKAMSRKICMVTGATAGIGEVTARALAQQGATVIVVGRNKQKCVTTVNRIQQQTGNSQVEYMLADLSSQQAIHQLAEQFKQKYQRLHVLLNNAGAIFLKRYETVDGIEMTFALNHLNYFLLTALLLDTLKASAPARIINVSSGAHLGRTINFDDLQGEKQYRSFEIYGQSKLANIMFTYELAKRLAGTGVTANALHPGFVATEFAKNNGMLARLFMTVARVFAISAEDGAQTSIYLATSPAVEGITGQYFYKQKAIRSSDASYAEAAAQRLWQISEELTHVAY